MSSTEYYRVECGSIAYGEFHYDLGDIIEVSSQNNEFKTNTWVKKRKCGGCDSYQKDSGGKPSCAEFQNEKHPFCNRDTSTYK
jgi:hypothetical protein